MFNWFSPNPVKSAKEVVDEVNTLFPTTQWKSEPKFNDNGEEYTLEEFMKYVSELKKENKDLKNLLISIEEDGTEEHNKAVELRQENAKLKATHDELIKEIRNLRHLKKENVELIERIAGKYYECNHCGYKIAHNTNQWGGCGCCKDGLMIEKEEQKYPIHWGGYDGAASAYPKQYSDWLNIEKIKAENSSNRSAEYGNLSKNFSNEFQDKISWEEAALDLSLRVVKLEKIIEELKLIRVDSPKEFAFIDN